MASRSNALLAVANIETTAFKVMPCHEKMGLVSYAINTPTRPAKDTADATSAIISGTQELDIKGIVTVHSMCVNINVRSKIKGQEARGATAQQRKSMFFFIKKKRRGMTSACR